uniref:Uncharacterized protein n=1 Tax=Anopheles arabiensis TaxID=7173 RepID=A0A182IF13_ANOAR
MIVLEVSYLQNAAKRTRIERLSIDIGTRILQIIIVVQSEPLLHKFYLLTY